MGMGNVFGYGWYIECGLQNGIFTKRCTIIALYFSNDSKDIGIGVTINLSEQDKVGLEIGANYYYEEKNISI